MDTVTLYIMLVISVWLVAQIKCDVGFTVQYQVNHTSKTYEAATEACQDQGGDLPQPQNAGEQRALVDALHGQAIGQLWIGLKRGWPVWRWQDGSPLDSEWNNWDKDKGQPNNGGGRDNEDCVIGDYSIFNVLWHDVSCTARYPFVCGNHPFDYTVNSTNMTYREAVEACKRTTGVNISQPKKWFEHQVMTSALNNQREHFQFWIGLKRAVPVWTWLGGAEARLQHWNSWGPSQPDNYENQEDCVHGVVVATGIVWQDVRCDDSYPYVCRFTTECPDGKFGLHCSGYCHCQVTCDKHDGRCPSHCDRGWQGADCQQECPNGKFGLNCASDCHCRDPCDKHDGSCPSRCESGWQGRDCQVPTECEDGKFGVRCMNNCHCNTTADCDKTTGRCTTGCQPGWTGSDCQQSACSHKAPCGIHICQEFGLDFNCSCLRGYENAGPYRCADVNECHHGDACDNHTCVNEEGSYRCVCRDGSYEHVAPQICVKRLVKLEEIEVQFFFPEEIKVKLVVIAFSTTILVFFAIVSICCVRTIVSTVYRSTTSEPYRSRRFFVRLSTEFGHNMNHMTMVISRHLSDVTDKPV